MQVLAHMETCPTECGDVRGGSAGPCQEDVFQLELCVCAISLGAHPPPTPQLMQEVETSVEGLQGPVHVEQSFQLQLRVRRRSDRPMHSVAVQAGGLLLLLAAPPHRREPHTSSCRACAGS